MSKISLTHYYVQEQQEGKKPETIAHTYNKEKNEYYHKFINKKQATKLAESEKENYPGRKFRVVKQVEIRYFQEWI